MLWGGSPRDRSYETRSALARGRRRSGGGTNELTFIGFLGGSDRFSLKTFPCVKVELVGILVYSSMEEKKNVYVRECLLPFSSSLLKPSSIPPFRLC